MNYNKELAKKLQKAVDTNKEWYSFKSLLGYQWARLFYIIGARECGKSFAALDFCLYRFFNKGQDFVWLRLTEASTKKLLNNNAMQFIDIQLMIKYNINSKDITVKGTTVFYKGKRMARILALSTFYNDKGIAMFEDKEFEEEMFASTIILDEFQFETSQKNTFDITYAFVNQIENLIRHRTNVRIILIGNSTESCSDLLTLVNFIPETYGRYKLKKKMCVIDYIPPSKKYLERRKGSIANLLAPDASTFTNEQKFDKSKIYKGRLRKPQFIIQFRQHSFTVWDSNVVCRHNKENKPIISMIPLMINNTVFKSELRDEVVLLNYEKKFMFKDLLTQKLFDKCIKEIKGIKG